MSAKTSYGVIHLDGIGAAFGGTTVLAGVDLEVRPGEAVGLLGPNGSGKTTLLRVVATLMPPSTGTGTVLGAQLGTDEIFVVRRQIALVGHVPSLYPELTLEENIAFVARLKARDAGAAQEALESVGLAGARRRPANQCSKGMIRRAEMARALVIEPELLLLDEAHAGLDQASIGLVDALTKRVTARGGAAILVSHDPDAIAGTVDRAVYLADGKLRDRGASG